MNLYNNRWTEFAVEAEIDSFGGVRLCKAHNALMAEVEKLRKVAEAAVRSVSNPAWAGICDEDVELERILQETGLLPGKQS